MNKNFTVKDLENLTEIEEVIIGFARRDGLKLGEYIKNTIESGQLVLPENATFQEIIDFHTSLNEFFEYDSPLSQKFFTSNLPMSYKLLTKIASSEFSAGGNFLLGSTGVVITFVSTEKYLSTSNRLAKCFYMASICCSGTASVSGFMKGISGDCGLSKVAMGADSLGGALLYLGKRAQDAGDIAQGKKRMPTIPTLAEFREAARKELARRSSFLSKKGSVGGNSGLAFLTDSSISSISSSRTSISQFMAYIPVKKYLLVGGSILTVYSYVKILILVYRYGKKTISKFSREKKMSSSQLLRKQARVLVNSFKETESQLRISRIYKFALSLN